MNNINLTSKSNPATKVHTWKKVDLQAFFEALAFDKGLLPSTPHQWYSITRADVANRIVRIAHLRRNPTITIIFQGGNYILYKYKSHINAIMTAHTLLSLDKTKFITGRQHFTFSH